MRLEPAKASGRKTANTVITNMPAILMGFELSEGTGAATLQLFNSGEATTDINKEVDYHATTGGSNSVNQFYASTGIDCPNGIYAIIGGTGAHYNVYYKLA